MVIPTAKETNMATVDKEIADRIIAGEFAEEDGWPARIVKYINAWGGESYGVEMRHEVGRYSPSEYVRNPTVYWTYKADT
jgi:hypothetical protein